jgi:hypothetical protein
MLRQTLLHRRLPAVDRGRGEKVRMRGSARRASTALAGVAITVGLLVGCTAAPEPVETTVAPTVTPRPTPTEDPTPTFNPRDSAESNIPALEFVLADLIAAGGIPPGASVVAALESAGVERSAMEITPDRTSIDLPVDALLFSVKIKGSCVLGQFDGDGFVMTTAPALASGACLLGMPVSLD